MSWLLDLKAPVLVYQRKTAKKKKSVTVQIPNWYSDPLLIWIIRSIFFKSFDKMQTID